MTETGWVAYSSQGDSAAQLFGNDPNYAPPSASNWNGYDGEIVLARVDANDDPTKLYRLALAHTRDNNAAYDNIAFDPRAVLSWDGKYVVFDSNAAWSSTGCGALTSCADVYLIQIH